MYYNIRKEFLSRREITPRTKKIVYEKIYTKTLAVRVRIVGGKYLRRIANVTLWIRSQM